MHSLSAVLSFVVLLALLLHIRKQERADNEEMNEKKYFLPKNLPIRSERSFLSLRSACFCFLKLFFAKIMQSMPLRSRNRLARCFHCFRVFKAFTILRVKLFSAKH